MVSENLNPPTTRATSRSLRVYHLPDSEPNNQAGPRIISLEERFHITRSPARDSLHRENLRPHVSPADLNMIVLDRTKSSGKCHQESNWDFRL